MNLTEKLKNFYQYLSTSEGLIAVVVSVLVFTVLYYYMIKFLFDNESGALAILFVFVMVIAGAIITFIDKINSAIYAFRRLLL